MGLLLIWCGFYGDIVAVGLRLGLRGVFRFGLLFVVFVAFVGVACLLVCGCGIIVPMFECCLPCCFSLMIIIWCVFYWFGLICS